MDNKMNFRFFVLLTFFCAFCASAFSQNVKRVEVRAELNRVKKGSKKERETIPLASAHILGFVDSKDAEVFFRRLKKGEVEVKESYENDCDVYELTDNEGLAYLTLPLDGRIVCIPRSSDEPVLKKIESNAVCAFVIVASVADTELDEQIVKAKRKEIAWKKVKTPRVGNRITQLPTPYPIPADVARENGRYGLAIHFIGLEDGDTLCHWRPFLKDGETFHLTQNRRMGYEMVDSFNIVHDKMGKFVSRYPMKSHEADSVIFSWDLMLPQGKYYRALADKWAEDYNGKYYKDTIELFDGYSPEPLRFLEFKIDDIPIDVSRYEMKGQMDEHESNMSLHFSFLNGQAELDPNDSTNNIEKQRLLEEFLPVYRDPENSHFSVKLVGKASPEGSFATNSRLSAERARTIAAWLAVESGFVGAHTESLVTSWTEVADTLERIGDVQKANDIREITRKYKTIEAQNPRVSALPYYSYLKEYILPKFRVVNFSFNFIVKRPLQKQEVIHNYNTNPAYRRMIKSGYEYMFLFDYLQEQPAELEEQARQAYQNIKETADHPRPWPLAAYHYSRCLTKAKRPDVNVLGPYFHREYGLDSVRNDENFRKQWWNDKAITVAEIGAYCAKGDYGAANFIVANYLPGEARFDKLRLFLRCFDNHYTEPEVIKAVASTSAFNKAVIYAAQDEEADSANLRYLREAWAILHDSVPSTDVRALYLKGSVGYRIFKANNIKVFYDGKHFTPKREFDEEKWKQEFKAENPEQSDYMVNMIMEEEKADFLKNNSDESIYWGNDIIRACQSDSTYLKILKFDGYFNAAFKKAFNFFWKGAKEGVDVYQLQQQWDALDAKEKQ